MGKGVAEHKFPGWAPLLFILAAVLTVSACGGTSMAPVAERSAPGDRPAGSSSRAVSTAGSEAADSDWTATVRPLGDAGGGTSRELSSPPPVPAPPENAKPNAKPDAVPASIQVSQSDGTASAAVNPAVVSLLNTASSQSRAGEHARAAATLERAIAIEPNNAWLWHRLAETRLKQGRLDQAAALAAKSNSLVSADPSVQADNWKLIAEVRRRQGDTAAAAAAESRAAKLTN